jgi:hypothetical protein
VPADQRAVRNQGNYPSAPGAVILKDPAQRSITVMPILVIRKGIFRSLIYAANLVRLPLATCERLAGEARSCFSALIACPDKSRLMDYFSLETILQLNSP